MRLDYLNLNSFQNGKQKDNTSFKGDLGKVVNPDVIEKLSADYLDNAYNVLLRQVPRGFITKNQGSLDFTKAAPLKDTVLFPFVKLPKEALIFLRDKFNIKGLKTSRMLLSYEQNKKDEAAQRALRGLFQNTDNYITDYINKTKTPLETILDDAQHLGENKTAFRDLYEALAGKVYSTYDDNFSKYKPKYHTPHERTVVRMVSGVTAASMLGNDFYNKSIMNGKDEQTATDELKTKRKQEIIATTEEAISQYFLLGAFSDFSNNSKWGAPILNTILGLIFHVTSRLSTKRPLVRIKPKNDIKYQAPGIQAFKASAKKNQPLMLEQKKPNKPKKKDNHLLSAKNIALACGISIVAGFGLKGIQGTKVFNNLKEQFLAIKPIKGFLDRYHSATMQEVWVTKKELEEFLSTLKAIDKEEMAAFYNNKVLSRAGSKQSKVFINPDDTQVEKFLLGEFEKMAKIPILNIEMSKKEFLRIPLMPFKIVFELVSYPYKAAAKIWEGIAKSYKNKHNPETIPNIILEARKKRGSKENPYGLLNTYRDYIEQRKLNRSLDEEEFIKLYKKRLEDNIISALNKETKSSVDNAAIGKMTQLLSLFGSLYFATVDDYNRTIRQTGDVDKASKDARLRGVNKMIRTVTQSVFLGINQLFKIPYATSILNAGIITAACTVITDTFSRVLSGMPSKRMNKEELEEYNKNMKEGPLRGYYKMLDKLTD